jgi:hypothetical protein
MTLRQDIAAINNDTARSDEQKRVEIYALKVNALVTRLAGMLNTGWIVGTATYRLLAVSSATESGALVLMLRLQRTGSNFNVVDDLVVVNPPISDGTRDIDAMNAAQLATFGRTMIGTLPPLPGG